MLKFIYFTTQLINVSVNMLVYTVCSIWQEVRTQLCHAICALNIT